MPNNFSGSTTNTNRVSATNRNNSLTGRARSIGNNRVVNGIRSGARTVGNIPIIRGARSGIGAYVGRKANRVAKKINDFNPGKAAIGAAKGIVKGYGALGAATAGAILGIAGGDPSKAVQYATTGAVGGYKAVDGMLSDTRDFDYATEEAKKSYYGDNYEEIERQEYIKKVRLDENNRRKIYDSFKDKKEAKDFMNNDLGYYAERGITNVDDMITANKMIKDENIDVKNRDMAIATIKCAQRVGAEPKKMKAKDRDDWKNTFGNEFRRNRRVQAGNLDADEEAEKTMIRIQSYYDMKK